MKIGTVTTANTGTTIANTRTITSGMTVRNVHTDTGLRNDEKTIGTLQERNARSNKNTGSGAINIPKTHGNDVSDVLTAKVKRGPPPGFVSLQ